MKMKTFLSMEEGDFDVYDTIIDGPGIAIVLPVLLTEYGENYYHRLMNWDVQLKPKNSIAIVRCPENDDYGHTSNYNFLERFLWAAAGYINSDEYDKLFKEEDN